VVIAVIVIVGVALIVLSKDSSSSANDTPPYAALGNNRGDHWHAYLGFDVCGSWLPPQPQFESQNGIHSHGDGLIHIHPFSIRAAGKRAVVRRVIEDDNNGDYSLSGSSFHLWDDATHKNGDKCGTGKDAKSAVVQWTVGHFGKTWTGKPRTGDPADYHPKNGDIIAVYLLPKGAKLEKPPGADAALANIEDLGGAPATSGGTATTTPGATDTTAPGGTATTASTVPTSTSSSTP
jgi:hypothetical protein